MNIQKKEACDYAVMALVVAILSFIHVAGIEKALVSIIFGFVALNKIQLNKQLGGRKIAIGAITIGIVYIVFATFALIYMFPRMQKFMPNAM